MKYFMLALLAFAWLSASGQLTAQATEPNLGVPQEQELVLARVEVAGKVADLSLPVYAHLQDGMGRDYALAIATVAQLDSARVDYEIIDFCHDKPVNSLYFIALERRQGARGLVSSVAGLLHDDGRQVIVRATEEQAHDLSMIGFDVEELATSPIAMTAPEVEPIAAAYHPIVAEMVAAVTQDALYTYTGNLSGEQAVTVGGVTYTIVSRHTKSGEPIQKATQYVYEFMENLGLAVSFHDWQNWSVSNRNVIGNKLGSTKPNEIVLVTAHLDSMPSSTTNSPGADDNGSGSAAIMVLAEILSNYNLERTVRFAFFTGEEQGLYGSRAYADKVAKDGDKIVAVYNMDMISWDKTGGPALRLHTRTTSSSGYSADRAIADLFAQSVTTYQTGMTTIVDADGITASDHSSFWNKGFAGILAIEDDEDDFCENYHTSRDKLNTLNIAYFTNYVKSGIATIAHLAGMVPEE